MQNRDFLVCYNTFPRKKGFLRKKSGMVGVRWFLFFSVIDFKSQISFWEAVSEEDVKVKYQVKLFQNVEYWPGLMNVYISIKMDLPLKIRYPIRFVLG